MSPTDDMPQAATPPVDGSLTMGKRTFIASAVGVGLASVAGCTGDESGNESDPETESDGSDGAGDGGDASNGNNGGGDSSDNPDLPDLEEPESYIMELRFSGEESTEESPPSVYEVHGDDLIFYQEGSKDETAYYIVDGDLYQVMGDQCMKMDEDDPGNVVEEPPEYDPSETYGFEYVGTETIDGVELEVYRQDGTENYRVFIDPETNYVRRLEPGGAGTTTVFHSFDEVDPIEPPDMECQDVSGGELTVETTSGG